MDIHLRGEPASEDQVRGIKELFEELHALRSFVREERAEKVIEQFKELQAAIHINRAAANPSCLDNVKYLYILALHKDYPEVRTALTQAFQAAAKPT
ncbi:MAG: hypothetical protein ACLP2P_00590 [Desulfobaccales bacterium]